MFTKRLIAAGAALCIALSAPAMAGKRSTVPVLSEIEIEDLLFMREEEKLARDVYADLYQFWKEQEDIEMLVLANIAVSEQLHMDAMLKLLEKYRLEDPAEDTEPGEFENQDLAELFDNLVSESHDNVPVLNEPSSGGRVSPEAAMLVGAWIEERDMLDILHAIDNTSRADIVGVYTNLLCGSRLHLRAFVKQLGGDDYVPQLLHPEADGDVPAVETLEYWLGDASDEICL